MATLTIVKADLQFILQQIRIAEAHAGGAALIDLVGNPLLPWGLRTVDGTYNSLVAGQEFYGAADRLMPRLLTPVFRDAENGSDAPGAPPGFPVRIRRPPTRRLRATWSTPSRGPSAI